MGYETPFLAMSRNIEPLVVNNISQSGVSYAYVRDTIDHISHQTGHIFLLRSDFNPIYIDSLRNYTVKVPIPVIVECVDGDEFIAYVREANIAMSGCSASEAFHLLKDDIEATYERYSREEKLGPEPKRQLSFLEKHIGETREQNHYSRGLGYSAQTKG